VVYCLLKGITKDACGVLDVAIVSNLLFLGTGLFYLGYHDRWLESHTSLLDSLPVCNTQNILDRVTFWITVQ